MVELMITLTVLAVIMVVLTTVMYTASRSKTATSNRIESTQASRAAVDMIARDLRSAGYGADFDYTPAPQPPIAYIDSLELIMAANYQPYPDEIGKFGPPLAYSPTGNPKPFRLNGTAWTPAIRYRTGAELVRWTLDVNNDGTVDANDIASAEGVDARRTPNPNDYVLVRQVYGDSTGNVSGNNGGTTERVALVRRPGNTVPPIFTVYLQGNALPWDWSSGAIPPAKLSEIERVVVQVVAPSGRPDWRGRYAETPIKTEVFTNRNVPNYGIKEFTVDGYVFDDKNKNGVKDAGEPGLAGVGVSLGTLLSTSTNASGYFLFSASAGTYVLKHSPPANYRTLTNPDSFFVTIGPGVTRSFADTAIAGGWLIARVYEDDNKNSIKDTKDPWREDEILTKDPGGWTASTNSYGEARVFAEVGAYTLTLAVPDSFSCTALNPVTGVMANGDSAIHWFSLVRVNPGKIKGLVWQDKNNNGIIDGGEKGVGNVWVGINNVYESVVSYVYTENDGKYEIEVPANDPPRTDAYTVECIPPPAYYPTTSTQIGGVFVKSGETISNNNFGINSFQQIDLNSARVLSLAAGDLAEKDWKGTKIWEAHQDLDVILGADVNGSDQLSVWFNQYNDKNLFDPNRSYSRGAPHSVLALAADSLDEDAAPFSGRMDVVTGTKYTASGNFFVWFTQGTSGNEGYFKSTYDLAYTTKDNGDVQAVRTADLVGNEGIDLVVGTKSPTAGQGKIELWKNSGGVNPTFSRDDEYPPKGNIPGNNLGEVAAIELAQLGGDNKLDMVVGTRTGDYSGQLLVFMNKGGFNLDQLQTLVTGAVTAATCADYNLDGKTDVVAGVQTAWNKGELHFWRNVTPGGSPTLAFVIDSILAAPGIPLSLASGDLGGATNPDIVMGFRNNNVDFTGGVRIYYMEGGKIPAAPVDPSGGTVTGMVPAVIVSNFNYGVQPSLPPPPYQLDIAAGIKTGPTTGALSLFIR